MAQIVEIFGEHILNLDVDTVADLLHNHQSLSRKQRELLLKEWATITGADIPDDTWGQLQPPSEG